jgi:hypothetical protein
MMTNSLPTIAQQYHLNEVKFPALYPDKYCKCCTMSNAIETVFHALCICPVTAAEARENAFAIMAEHLHRKIDDLSVDGRSLQSFFCSPDNFQRGLIEKNVFSVLVDAGLQQEGSPLIAIDVLCTLLQPELIRAFSDIWKDRNRLMNLNGWSFNTRTKAVYDQNRRQFFEALMPTSPSSAPVQLQCGGPMMLQADIRHL